MSTRSAANRPRAITQIGERSLQIEWADGHTSELTMVELRRLCPCAECLAERRKAAAAGPLRILGPEPSTRPAKLEQAGNYAIAITWSDQHYSILAFDRLRAHCPCAACAAQRAGE